MRFAGKIIKICNLCRNWSGWCERLWGWFSSRTFRKRFSYFHSFTISFSSAGHALLLMVEIRKSEAKPMKRKCEDQAFFRVQIAFTFSFHFRWTTTGKNWNVKIKNRSALEYTEIHARSRIYKHCIHAWRRNGQKCWPILHNCVLMRRNESASHKYKKGCALGGSIINLALLVSKFSAPPFRRWKWDRWEAIVAVLNSHYSFMRGEEKQNELRSWEIFACFEYIQWTKMKKKMNVGKWMKTNVLYQAHHINLLATFTLFLFISPSFSLGMYSCTVQCYVVANKFSLTPQHVNMLRMNGSERTENVVTINSIIK